MDLEHFHLLPQLHLHHLLRKNQNIHLTHFLHHFLAVDLLVDYFLLQNLEKQFQEILQLLHLQNLQNLQKELQHLIHLLHHLYL
jgi:hypothetical protein